MTVTVLACSERVECPHCFAKPGEPCRISTGFIRGWSHTARGLAAQKRLEELTRGSA